MYPARSFLPVWERLGYEVHPETGTILLVLDMSRICIPRGTEENGKIDGSMRKKIVNLLHIPHLGEVKTGRAAEKRYIGPQSGMRCARR